LPALLLVEDLMQPTIPDWLQDIRQADQLFEQKKLDEAVGL
jgi:hypothetical protein